MQVATNITHYRMSSIYHLVRTDCQLLNIPAGLDEIFALDINASYYRIVNIRFTTPDSGTLFNLLVNEDESLGIGPNTLLQVNNITPPFLEDRLNVFGVNKSEDSNLEDNIFIYIDNDMAGETITQLNFSITVEKLQLHS